MHCVKIRRKYSAAMASQIGFYSQLPISLIRIVDTAIVNKNQIGSDINNSN